MFDILPTDKVFTDSPFSGDPACLCSRCGNLIKDRECPVRCWTADGSLEYRFCEKCCVKAGMIIFPLFNQEEEEEEEKEEWEQDIDFIDEQPRSCRECGCNNRDACYHPKYGNCWWVEPDLCSHCFNWPGQATRHSKLREKNDPL